VRPSRALLDPAKRAAARLASAAHRLLARGDRPGGVAATLEPETAGCWNGRIVIASGKVVDGRVELDSKLPEGASVTVLVREGDETFEADPETESMLLTAIAQCDRGETIPMAQLLGEFRDRE
jgi:hypothetical protein